MDHVVGLEDIAFLAEHMVGISLLVRHRLKPDRPKQFLERLGGSACILVERFPQPFQSQRNSLLGWQLKRRAPLNLQPLNVLPKALAFVLRLLQRLGDGLRQIP